MFEIGESVKVVQILTEAGQSLIGNTGVVTSVDGEDITVDVGPKGLCSFDPDELESNEN